MEYRIAIRLIQEMGFDDGVNYRPTIKQIVDLAEGVRKMRVAGCPFHSKHRTALVAGEESKTVALLSKYHGFEEVTNILKEIFEGEIEPC